MGLADEIRELMELHNNGTLTDAEFEQAKAAVLAGSASAGRPSTSAPDNTFGGVAKKWVNFQIVMAVVGVVLALIFFFGFFLPNWNKSESDFDRRWNELRGTPSSKLGK